MNVIDAYDGIKAAEANGFKLNEDIANGILRKSLFSQSIFHSGSFYSIIKSEDEVTEEDKEWARTHIVVTNDYSIIYLYERKKHNDGCNYNPANDG